MSEQKAVLLVDKEPNLLRLNMRVLEREGYYVLPARTLRDARSLIKDVVFHAAVLDVELEDGSGLDFCRELRETRDVPVVLLTALKVEESEKAGYDAGANDYITKPYRIEELTESIEALLARTIDQNEIETARRNQ